MGRGNKRVVILRAVEEMVKNRRFHEVTLDEVADAAKVAKGTIYRYFKDKDDLFFQLATAGFDELCEMLHECVCEKMPFDETLVSMCTRISEFFRRRRALMRVMREHEGRQTAFRDKRREAWSAKREKLTATVARILESGIGGGYIRQDVPLEIPARFLLSMMRSRGHDFSDDHAQMPSIELVVKLFLQGMGPRD